MVAFELDGVRFEAKKRSFARWSRTHEGIPSKIVLKANRATSSKCSITIIQKYSSVLEMPRPTTASAYLAVTVMMPRLVMTDMMEMNSKARIQAPMLSARRGAARRVMYTSLYVSEYTSTKLLSNANNAPNGKAAAKREIWENWRTSSK